MTTDKTIKSKYQPKQTNVTWVDLSGETPIEKHFINGRWVAINSGGSGGTTDYSSLDNKPSINGVSLNGNKTAEQLNVVSYDNQSVTDQQRNTALANVSNQTANSTTGKMGYKVLDPTKTFAEQVTAENTIYEIKGVFNLNGGSVTIPSGCTLNFAGGKVTNGTLNGNDTAIEGNPIFDNVIGGGYYSTQLISVKWFGAKGDGVTDDTIAIKKALQFIINISYHGSHNGSTNYNNILNSLYFPTGRYIITESNIFASYTTNNPKFYLSIIGDDKSRSVLILKTNSANELWFYNTEGSGNYNKSGFFTLKNLFLTTDDINYGSGFLQYSTGQEKQLRVENCSINLGVFIHNDGTGNADLTVVDKCTIICNNCIIISNPQSVANRFINCNIFPKSDCVVRYGGTASFTMCEIDLFYNDAEYPTIMAQIAELEASKEGKTQEEIAEIDAQIAAIKYNVGLTYNGYATNRKNIVLDHGAGSISSVIDFESCRFELHGIVGLYHSDNKSGKGTSFFNNCSFGVFSNYADFISSVFGKVVTLTNCTLPFDFSVKFLGDSTITTSSFISILNCVIKSSPTITGRGGYVLVEGSKTYNINATGVDSNNFDMQYSTTNHSTSLKEFSVEFPYADMIAIKSGSKLNSTIGINNTQSAIGYLFSAKYVSGAGMPNDPQTFTIEGSTDGVTYENITTIEAGAASQINVIKEGIIAKNGYKYFKLTRTAQYPGARPGCDIKCVIKYI